MGMEKRKPHYDLCTVISLVAAGKARITGTALMGGAALGFDAVAILGVVKGLLAKEFYKSMTTYHDRRVWQDVYRAETCAGQVYVKLTVQDEVVVISFKEL